MPITRNSTLTDVCFAVCTALHRTGATVVLTGGSAATFYAPERYQSRDADFIMMSIEDAADSRSALHELGFTESGGIYHHPQSPYTLEFPSGPLAIGSSLITNYETFRRDDELLNVLSRTDVIRDRLAAFYHWGDRSSLRTALDVAIGASIDLKTIEQWSEAEGALEKFREFAERLRENSNG